MIECSDSERNELLKMLGITNEKYLMLNYTNISEVEDLDNISKGHNLDASISRDDALKDFHKIAQELVNEDKDLANDIYAPTPDARRLKDKIFKKDMLRLENPPEDLRHRRLIRLNSLAPEKLTEKECNIYNRKYIDLIDDFDSYIMVKHALGYKDKDDFAYEKTFKYKWRVFKWKLKGLKKYIQYLYHLKV